MERITFVAGRAGAGKSRYLRERMRELLDKKERVLVIVPEQFTFETERELTEAFSGGLYNVSVFSFTTLARRVLKKSGERNVFLSPEGMRMVIKKSVSECEKKLVAFSGVAERPGFSETAASLFSMFKCFEIAPDALLSAAEKLPEDMLLKRKLLDLGLLYDHTEAYLSGRYLDSEDALNALLRLLPKSFITDRHVFIDGFDLLTEQIYRIIAALMRHAKSVSVSFRADFSPRCCDAAVFKVERRAYTRLFEEAKALSLTPKLIRLPIEGETERAVLPALRHLEKEGFAYPFAAYDGEPEGISLFAASDRTAEAHALADRISFAARRGIRYRDMAVVCTDMGAYLPIVSRVLHARGIPFFTDYKHPLSGYPAPRLLVYALRAATLDFSAADMAELAKTGLCGITPDEAEIFENYVIASGIRGKAFLEPFKRGEVPREAETARVVLIGPLLVLRDRLRQGKTAALKTEAVAEYMETLGVFEKQAELSEKLREEDRLELAAENAQVYNHIMEILSQLHAVMGDTVLTNKRFLAILSEGFDAATVGGIPATADQVLFGSVGRTRARSVRALFVIGANEGAFPLLSPDEAFIDDRELGMLGDLGVTPWDSSFDRAAVALADVYSAVSKPTEELSISYPMTVDGTAQTACALVDRVQALFPTLTVGTDVNAAFSPVSPEGAFLSLTQMLRNYADTGTIDPALAPLYAWFHKSETFKERLRGVEEALFFNNSPEPFGRELALALYGNEAAGSATRFEEFNACPFKHFAKYGLRIMPRKEFKERSLEEGVFLHEAISKYIDALTERYQDLSAVTRELCEALVDELLPPLIANHNNGVFLDTRRGMLRCNELVREVKATAWAATRQLSLGAFKVVSTELAFGLKDATLPPIVVELNDKTRFRITGKIDRLDAYESGGKTYFRVIDYKSGDKKFDFSELYYGLKLQLPLYAKAALAAKDAARAAGFYYLHIQEPVLSDEFKTSDAFEKQLFKEFRLKGLTLNDPEIVEAVKGSDEGYEVISAKRSPYLVDNSVIDAVLSYAGEKARDTLRLILDGQAEPRPYRYKSGGLSACTYCDYKSVCRFDVRLQGCAFRNLKGLSREEFMLRTGGGSDGKDKMDKGAN
ncbi:MAG TPA: PD-(D/E)XK nuclease family protein [Clostridia bacterium]|nr:PD-(D/E)XK nuclease family protein [Clostridia bacterium]